MLLCSLCLLMLPRLPALLLHYTQACVLFQTNKMLNEVKSPNIHTAGSQGEQTSGSGQLPWLPKQQLNCYELNGPLILLNVAFLMRAWFCSQQYSSEALRGLQCCATTGYYCLRNCERAVHTGLIFCEGSLMKYGKEHDTNLRQYC